jgi:hypothetical protein
LREGNRLRVFEKRVLRKIFEPKREEDASWRNLRAHIVQLILLG